MNRIPRRAILRSLWGALLLPVSRLTQFSSARGAGLLVEQLRPRSAETSGAGRVFYRADATILLLSLPIYRRRGAGGGCVDLEQCREGDVDTLVIRFRAGSYPEQARGLNRLGYIEEVVVKRASRVEELAYFGFMTSSPEMDVDEARRAIEDSNPNAVCYRAAEGHIHSGIETSRKSTLNLIDNRNWTEAQPLLEHVRTAFLEDEEADILTRTSQGMPATFLYSLLSAAWGRDESFEAAYSYLAKDYRMRVEKKPDPQRGQQMAKDGLTNSPESVVLLKGEIQEVGEGKTVHFKLWTEDNGQPGLPIRFEYKARPFLRVSFERDPTQAPSA